jgi:hypothetical protein
VIRKILKTRLKVGYIFRRLGRSRFVIKKDAGNYVAGFKAFKVDKRETDGWIEIRDAQTWELWALVRRFEALGYGALYLGFGLDRRPFAYFRPYRRIRNLETISEGVREINREFPFLRLSWTLRGGSLTGSRFHFRIEIIDLFGFVRFLSPVPSDVAQIVPRIDFPKFLVQRLVGDTFLLPLSVLLRGRLIYRVVLSWVVGDVLRVKRVVVGGGGEIGKYAVLGGYISPSSLLSPVGGIIKVDVWSGQTCMVVVGLSGVPGKVLQCCCPSEVGCYDRQDKTIPQ